MIINRTLTNELERWRVHPRRKPLMLRGARQVGKSWLVREFAKGFEYFVEINFEIKKQYKQAFQDDISAEKVIERIKFLTGIPIIPGKTLLFLDEIQECQEAIQALRYFKEDMPELHVISAGSLIDFALEKIGMPVGRIQFLYMYPLSFSEYLMASKRNDLNEYIKTGQVDAMVHDQLLEKVKTYMWLGGMPEVVQTWVDTRDIHECLEVQDEILLSYKQDIPKYAKTEQLAIIENVFESIPSQLGNKFIYKHVVPEVRSYILKNALLSLKKAGLAHVVYHSHAQGLPLAAQTNSRRFKVFSFDIGLMQRLLGFKPQDWLMTPLAVKHLGGIAEQFVAQEYIAYTSVKKPPELFYWHREDKGSNAEVDFIFQKNSTIYPAEVKSTSKGHLKSLHLFLESHPQAKIGLKISEAPFSRNENLCSIPFYMIEAWLLGHIN